METLIGKVSIDIGYYKPKSMFLAKQASSFKAEPSWLESPAVFLYKFQKNRSAARCFVVD
jgi:hypothetical protein